MTEAQRAALARGRAKRQANIKGRRAGRARQGASAQDAALRAEAQADASQPEAGAGTPASAPSRSASGLPSSETKPSKLSQAEQDKLLFDFAMGDGDEDGGGDEADTGDAREGRKGLGDRLSGLLLNEAPKAKLGGVTDQQEEDAQQAAAQWTDLVSVALIFIAGLVVSADLAPSEKHARAMAAPLCRIIMRHVDPLRTASADVYDIAAFGGAVLIYVQTIQPELARRRSERKVVRPNATSTARQEAERIGLRVVQSEPAGGSGRYHTQPSQADGAQVSEQGPSSRQAATHDAGTDIINEALGITI